MRISYVGLLATMVLVPMVLGAAATPAKRNTSAPPRHVLPFIADDYAKALAQAKERKLPIFIEAWAPW